MKNQVGVTGLATKLKLYNNGLRRDIKKKLGRNDLCVCGSGKKFKKCCIDENNKGNDPA